MTSLHAESTGVLRNFAKLAPEFVTLQEVFSAAGYATAAFSTNGNAGPARGNRVGVMGGAGGGMVEAADLCAEAGLELPPLPDEIDLEDGHAGDFFDAFVLHGPVLARFRSAKPKATVRRCAYLQRQYPDTS